MNICSSERLPLYIIQYVIASPKMWIILIKKVYVLYKVHKYSFTLDKYAFLMYIVLMIRICSGTGRGRRSYDPAVPGAACAGRTCTRTAQLWSCSPRRCLRRPDVGADRSVMSPDTVLFLACGKECIIMERHAKKGTCGLWFTAMDKKCEPWRHTAVWRIAG